MQPKINWIDNLRGIACLMVVMIHTTNVVHHQRPQRQPAKLGYCECPEFGFAR